MGRQPDHVGTVVDVHLPGVGIRLRLRLAASVPQGQHYRCQQTHNDHRRQYQQQQRRGSAPPAQAARFSHIVHGQSSSR